MPPNTQRKKLIIAASIIIIICLAIPIVIYLISSQYSATLSTTIAPSFAKLTIDGKEYPPNTELHLKPTQTKAIITADSFQTQEININLQKDETTKIALYLIPNNGDLSWYQEHPAEQELFQIVGGIEANADANNFIEEYPITKILPYQYANVVNNTPVNYRIDIGKFDNCKTNFCIKITDYNSNAYDHAIKYISDNGFNPDDYEITYEQKSPWS